ncbi:MAG: hypothetical protein K1X79_04035, partial [Oligoflexia bacterium]|nr:hypothetical protein [Oligoflexia bacterium]
INQASPGTSPLASQYTCYAAVGTILKVLEGHAGISTARDFVSALSPDQSVSLPDGELKFLGRNAQIPIRFRVMG